MDLCANMSPEDYAQRAIACLQAAASAETTAEHDRWTFEAIAWLSLPAGPGRKGEWPTSDQQRARRRAKAWSDQRTT
jgi:hypothetical protein